MRRRAAAWRLRRALLLCLVVLLPLTAGAAAQELQKRSLSVEERSVALYALAVAQAENGTQTGVAPPLEVTMRTGTGNVLVVTEPLTEIDMQGSARLAVTVAASIAGFDASGWDFLFVMRASAPVVGGPSAGGVMTTAAVALMMEWDLSSDVAMTGMINPDGTIGPVGGIPAKLEAAAAKGAGLLLVPEGQRVVYETVQEVRQNGAFQQVVTRQVPVDLVEKGRGLGVEVREARDAYDAVEAFTGYRIERRLAQGPVASEAFQAIMGPAAQGQLEEARRFREAVEGDAGAAALEPAVGQQVERLIAEGDERLDAAQRRYDARSYYSASSLVFQARLKLRLADLLVAVAPAADARAAFDEAAQAVGDEANRIADGLKAADAATVSGLSALGTAQDRILEARDLHRQAVQAGDEGNLAGALDRLAFAQERVATATWWAELADVLDDPAAGQLGLDVAAQDLARQQLTSAISAVTYARLIVRESGSGGTPAEILSEGEADLQRAGDALNEGYAEASIFLALEAQVAGFTALSLIGAPANLTERLDAARNRALVEVENARALGMEPVVAVGLLDFGETLRGENPTRALLFFAQAGTIARAGGLLAGAATTAPRVTFVGPSWWQQPDLLTLGAVGLGGVLAGLAIAGLATAARAGTASPAPSPREAGANGRRVPLKATPRGPPGAALAQPVVVRRGRPRRAAERGGPLAPRPRQGGRS